jgi:hypothetical protein
MGVTRREDRGSGIGGRVGRRLCASAVFVTRDVTRITRTLDDSHAAIRRRRSTLAPVNAAQHNQSVAQPGEIGRVPYSLVAFTVLPHLSVGT